MLAESELEQIRDEAKEKYPLPTVQYMVSTHTVVRAERQACIAALTSEREKIKVLVEALELLIEAKDYKDGYGKTATYETLKNRAWDKARTALTNYQKTIQP